MPESATASCPNQTEPHLSAQVARLQAALAARQAELTASQAMVEQLTAERDQLRQAYEQLRLELELLKRRLFVAKAERVDTAQLELEFKDKLAALAQLEAQLAKELEPEPQPPSGPPPKGPTPGRSKPTGRRNLSELDLPTERIEVDDPQMEQLCKSGQAERIGFEESSKLAWQRGGHKRLIIARVKYRVPGDPPQTPDIVTSPRPSELIARSMAAPSLLAYIAVAKYCDGLPLFRIEDRFARDGVKLDRGSMCRWLEDLGATCGATVIEAARKEALSKSFCIATDATGIRVQPIPTGKRQPCAKGHYLVQIADQDHVFFEYTPKETTAAVGQMFHGYSGFVLADAKNVFDWLFQPPEVRKRLSDEQEDDPGVRIEVGCWAHARRKFWESALSNCPLSREALVRIGRFFDLDKKWRGRPPDKIKLLRNTCLRPQVQDFFTWAATHYDKVRDQRGLLRSALGYALRHKDALMRFLQDGRLPLDNNGSERQLRKIAVGRKAWLFVGSDDHATAAGHLLSLIASARLHGLDPETYLRDLFRVLAHWPKERYLELSPKHWVHTRSRLDPAQLQAELGPLTIPPPLPSTTEEQPISN